MKGAVSRPKMMVYDEIETKSTMLSQVKMKFITPKVDWKSTLTCGRPYFLHSSFSTTNLSLSDASFHANGYSEEKPESTPLLENVSATERKECPEDENCGKEVHSELKRKAARGPMQGIYRAILIGEAGCAPYQKILRVGKVTLFSLGTSGMRNNRKPYENETPEQYARRSFVQWHRIAIYQHHLSSLAMKFVKKGSQVYVEGNLEARVFLEPESNAIKQIQEIAVRKSGRIIFLDQNKVKI